MHRGPYKLSIAFRMHSLAVIVFDVFAMFFYRKSPPATSNFEPIQHMMVDSMTCCVCMVALEISRDGGGLPTPKAQALVFGTYYLACDSWN